MSLSLVADDSDTIDSISCQFSPSVLGSIKYNNYNGMTGRDLKFASIRILVDRIAEKQKECVFVNSALKIQCHLLFRRFYPLLLIK